MSEGTDRKLIAARMPGEDGHFHEVEGVDRSTLPPLEDFAVRLVDDLVSGAYSNFAATTAAFDGKPATVLVSINSVEDDEVPQHVLDEVSEGNVAVAVTPIALLLTGEWAQHVAPPSDDVNDLVEQIGERNKRRLQRQHDHLVERLAQAKEAAKGNPEVEAQLGALQHLMDTVGDLAGMEPTERRATIEERIDELLADRPSSEVAEDLTGSRPAAPSDD